MWPRYCLVFSALALTLNAFASCPLKDGDMIFIKSQSTQASLLKVATDSEWSHVGMAFKQKKGWDVIEAVGPVKWTSLYTFIRRSRNLHFQVKRATFPFNSAQVKASAEAHLGGDYDLIFAWDDQRWYCTELVWKAYLAVTGQEMGSLEKIGDLHVDHPLILKEAERRFTAYGQKFDLEEWKNYPIITPLQMMKAPNLEAVTTHSGNMADFRDCLIQR